MIKINKNIEISYDAGCYTVAIFKRGVKINKDGNKVEFENKNPHYFATLKDCCLFILDMKSIGKKVAKSMEDILENLERCKNEIIEAINKTDMDNKMREKNKNEQ